LTDGRAPPLSIWVTGDTLPEVERERGSFADLIRATVAEAWPGPWNVLDVTDPGAVLPEPDRLAGVIVTGSPARIADQTPWMRRAQESLRSLVAHNVPVLGICFGHQLLAVALGGRSGPNTRGREIGTVLVSWERPDAVLGDMPPRFHASATHLDTVLELPPGAESLASTSLDRYAAVRFGPRAWGVQFHPEMDGAAAARYVAARPEALRAEGLDPDALLAACRDTPASAELLRRFARVCAAGSGR
jgi:GMP synthase (glutamine-hydrolysing)